MRTVPELDIAAARQYSAEWRASQEPPPVPRAAEMADCISCGLAGMALVNALRRHFPNAPRHEVYLAIGMAIAILQADLSLAEMHREAA